MAIKVGGTNTADAAYAANKANAESSKAGKTGNVLKELQQQFSDLNIGIGGSGKGATFSSGLNNVSIAPNILKQMAEDPEARAKYEAELSGISDSWRNANNVRLQGGGRIVYQEYVIMSDGNVGIISIAESGGNANDPVFAKRDKDDKEGALEKLMKTIEEKTKKQMEKAMKTANKDAAENSSNTSAQGHLDIRA